MFEIRVCIRVMHHGRLGTINWADSLRLAILTLDACHVQTMEALRAARIEMWYRILSLNWGGYVHEIGDVSHSGLSALIK
jgi:hypothetical protein